MCVSFQRYVPSVETDGICIVLSDCSSRRLPSCCNLFSPDSRNLSPVPEPQSYSAGFFDRLR